MTCDRRNTDFIGSDRRRNRDRAVGSGYLNP